MKWSTVAKAIMLCLKKKICWAYTWYSDINSEYHTSRQGTLNICFSSLPVCKKTDCCPKLLECCNPLATDTFCSKCCWFFCNALLQVYRYGMLLLQASPPHICVSDVGRRITSVPGVQAVHELHIWQLTESITVASVHVHCHAAFPFSR